MPPTDRPNPHLPGLDPEGTPVVMLGLSLTGLLLGLRSRLAPWSLALTAAAALLFRNPRRTTPHEPDGLFAPADGVVTGLEEFYEHRFLHTDAVCVTIETNLVDVPVQRSPVSGRVAYLALDPADASVGERQYIGMKPRVARCCW